MGRYSNESVVVRKFLFIIGIAAYLLCVMGCMHYRDSYFVSTRGDLRKIKTQNRYTVVDLKHMKFPSALNTFPLKLTKLTQFLAESQAVALPFAVIFTEKTLFMPHPSSLRCSVKQVKPQQNC